MEQLIRWLKNFLLIPVKPIEAIEPIEVAVSPVSPMKEIKTPVEKEIPYLWDTPEFARHSIRVIADEENLSLKDKNLLCAVIKAESGFKNTAINKNRNTKGETTSTDWGICQINDYWHIGKWADGKNKSFPSVEYVLQNPDKVVRWMIKMLKAGKINLWSAYVNGSYKKYL